MSHARRDPRVFMARKMRRNEKMLPDNRRRPRRDAYRTDTRRTLRQAGGMTGNFVAIIATRFYDRAHKG